MHDDLRFMRLALRLARRGYGTTSPNPMVGAVLVRGDRIIGQGWHHRAGEPHAEVEALGHAVRRGFDPKGATLYVTLEPCCTQGRTPPCTEAILAAGIRRVVAGARDPNPRHCGKGFEHLRRRRVAVTQGLLAQECERLNESFNHWIVHRTPFVTVKAAMTLDGKIATASGESKWITSEPARAYGVRLRQGADAILVGVNTVLADNPSLTVRGRRPEVGGRQEEKRLRRIVLDSLARTPADARVVSDVHRDATTVIVSEAAPKSRVAALARKVHVLVAPLAPPLPPAPAKPSGSGRTASPKPRHLDLVWLMQKLGSEEVTSLLVEGGGEVNASFLFQGLAHRVAFFYAPKVLGGSDSCKAVAGSGAGCWDEILDLTEVEWRRLGPDWLLSARVLNR
jgi:diaminohydroxyphosphoribosylaminopyrimidine deaminase/5-amino-6-(5-phosphoribosylamino)uracil reductase